jgi:hypothetical protein
MSTAVAGTTSVSRSFRPTRSYTNPRDVTGKHSERFRRRFFPASSQDGRMRRLVLVRRIFRGLDNRGVEGREARAAYDLWRTSRA